VDGAEQETQILDVVLVAQPLDRSFVSGVGILTMKK